MTLKRKKVIFGHCDSKQKAECTISLFRGGWTFGHLHDTEKMVDSHSKKMVIGSEQKLKHKILINQSYLHYNTTHTYF